MIGERDFAEFSSEIKSGRKAYRCSYCDRIIPKGVRHIYANFRGNRRFCNQEHANRFVAAVEFGARPRDVVACTDVFCCQLVVVLIKGVPYLCAKESHSMIGMTLNGRTLSKSEWDNPIILTDGVNTVAKKDGAEIFCIKI